MAQSSKKGRPKVRADGVDRGPVWRQIRVAELLGWDYWVEGERVRYKAPPPFKEEDAPWLAQTQLGLLYGRGIIGEDAYRAGRGFQAACWRAYGAPFARAIDYARLPDAGGYEEMDHGAAQRFVARAKQRVRERCRVSGVRVVEELCQYDRELGWDDPLVRGLVVEALDVLADFMG